MGVFTKKGGSDPPPQVGMRIKDCGGNIFELRACTCHSPDYPASWPNGPGCGPHKWKLIPETGEWEKTGNIAYQAPYGTWNDEYEILSHVDLVIEEDSAATLKLSRIQRIIRDRNKDNESNTKETI